MTTKTSASPKNHDGLNGQIIERLFGSNPNCRDSADICISGTWYEIKSRENKAISPITLFGISDKGLTETEFEQKAKNKLPNMIVIHYDKINNEIRITSAQKWTGFNYAKFVELMDSRIIYREAAHHRTIPIRVRGYNFSKLAQMFDSVEDIDINDYVKDQNSPNSDDQQPASQD